MCMASRLKKKHSLIQIHKLTCSLYFVNIDTSKFMTDPFNAYTEQIHQTLYFYGSTRHIQQNARREYGKPGGAHWKNIQKQHQFRKKNKMWRCSLGMVFKWNYGNKKWHIEYGLSLALICFSEAPHNIQWSCPYTHYYIALFFTGWQNLLCSKIAQQHYHPTNKVVLDEHELL